MKLSELFENMSVDSVAFTIDCTGDACAGDTIKFSENVFGGSFKKPSYLGDREIIAKILKDSYGADKQQHTFTIEVLASSGVDPIAVGTKTTRKGRNVYRNGTKRLPWSNEEDRKNVLDDKHARGNAARNDRKMRRGY